MYHVEALEKDTSHFMTLCQFGKGETPHYIIAKKTYSTGLAPISMTRIYIVTRIPEPCYRLLFAKREFSGRKTQLMCTRPVLELVFVKSSTVQVFHTLTPVLL